MSVFIYALNHYWGLISSSSAAGQIPFDSSLHGDVPVIPLLFLCVNLPVCLSVTCFAFGTGVGRCSSSMPIFGAAMGLICLTSLCCWEMDLDGRGEQCNYARLPGTVTDIAPIWRRACSVIKFGGLSDAHIYGTDFPDHLSWRLNGATVRWWGVCEHDLHGLVILCCDAWLSCWIRERVCQFGHYCLLLTQISWCWEVNSDALWWARFVKHAWIVGPTMIRV